MIKRHCKFCAVEFHVGSMYSNRKFCTPECRFKSIVPLVFDKDVCFLWPKSLNKVTGYGQFNVANDLNAVMVSSHRMSYKVFNGELTAGMYICHACDNRACINPKHLFAGSQKDNVTDMWSKNRQQDYKNIPKGDDNPSRKHPEKLSRGASHYASKLNENDVREIRASIESHAALSRRYGVRATSIANVRAMRSWTHIN